jgi:hypothetical protein
MIMVTLITKNFNLDNCFLTNYNKNTCSDISFMQLLSQNNCQEKINVIRKNMAISEKILVEINDKFLTNFINDSFIVINDLLLFYKVYISSIETVCPYLNLLVLQTYLLVSLLYELNHAICEYSVNSPEWTYLIQKSLIKIISNIVSTVSNSFTLELQTQNRTNQIILLPCAKCNIEKNRLRNNITLLETLLSNSKPIAFGILVTLISNLNLLSSFINCRCNKIIGNLLKVINNQLHLFIILIPMIPLLPQSFCSSFEESALNTTNFLLIAVQSLQILTAQFNNVSIKC